MPWARFDDRFPSNRKIRKLSDSAFRLYVSAICWSAENLTDGFIADDDLSLVSDVKRPVLAAKELVSRGLLHAIPGGFSIHDYFDYNPRASQVRAERTMKTERQQRWREGRRKAAQGADNTPGDSTVDASTGASTDASEDAAPTRPDPTRPVVLPSEVHLSPSAEGAEHETTKRKRTPRAPVAPRFDEFWKAYPRRLAKGAAEAAWTKAINCGADPSAVIDAARFYALERRLQDPQFTKYPATWLNQKCWLDEPDPAYKPPAITGPSEASAVQPPSWAETQAAMNERDRRDRAERHDWPALGAPFTLDHI